MTEQSGELRIIAADLEVYRARLEQIAAQIAETPYTQAYIDATMAAYHAFTAAKIAGQLAERLEAAAAANPTPRQEQP